MFIETDTLVYETFFRYAQVEITGVCNMRCKHCRASDEAAVNIPLETMEKILIFALANSEKDFCLTISGGEPFCHPLLLDVIKMAKVMAIKNIAITTNGSLVTDRLICQIENIGVTNFYIQVSIDSSSSQAHDHFRGYKGAFKKAIACLKMIAGSKIKPSIRSTILPDKINEMEEIIKLAIDCGVASVDMNPVVPVGRGAGKSDLLMSPVQKKIFFDKIVDCIKKYPNMDITTEDPLQFAYCSRLGADYSNTAFFGGCIAGVASFSANSLGDITACALLPKIIVNVNLKTIEEIVYAYANSEIIKKLAERRYSGKCGICNLNRVCGGCRAVAEGANNDYLSSDVTCWR
jgi:radical SAM protein with 4Fe4S-binding SPASM domain